MNHSCLSRCALSVCAGVSILAGCGGSPSPSALPDQSITAVKRSFAHPHRRASWISPEARNKAVLFIDDLGTKDVYIVSLSILKVIGTISGFSGPGGLCSDTKGDVWVPDYNVQKIYEYSHAGVLENTLTDGYGYPFGCAWDATTGNLAVMNYTGVSSGPGSVLVYAHAASGSESLYTNPGETNYVFGGYDTEGNLFFDGFTTGGSFILSELRKGATMPHTIKVVGGQIYSPGLVEWNATSDELVVGDLYCDGRAVSCVYSLSLSTNRRAATIKHKTKFKNSTGGPILKLVQGDLYNGTLYGSDFQTGITYEWPFPRGGYPKQHNTVSANPWGAAISK